MFRSSWGGRIALWPVAAACLLGVSAGALAKSPDSQDPLVAPGIIQRVDDSNGRLQMIVNSSRILTLEEKIPQVQVNNRDILELTPLSPYQVQIFAKKPGVTQVNLWVEGQNGEKQVRSLDVIVVGDSRELQMLLEAQFPNASLRVMPLATSVVISGYVDHPSQVSRIIEIAQDYHPKVINNISVGGVQQILLHCKVMEVSRTRLRRLGFDFAEINNGSFASSGISGLLNSASARSGTLAVTANTTVSYGVLTGANSFFGFLEALQQRDLLKVVADPTLVTSSGRPAFFNAGGEFPIIVPQSLGTVAIEYKKFGTQVDFVPIALGNGRIRLEVRPRVSEIDPTRSITLAGITAPGLRTREVDTGVEMQAGQTLAIAGLLQTRVDSQVRGLPWVSDLPYLGALFRRVNEQMNEVELLIMVTPQLAEAMNCEEVPPGGPGAFTTTPSDYQLYLRGNIEVPGDVRDGGYNSWRKQDVWDGVYNGPKGGYGGDHIYYEDDGHAPSEAPSAEPVPPQVPGRVEQLPSQPSATRRTPGPSGAADTDAVQAGRQPGRGGKAMPASSSTRRQNRSQPTRRTGGSAATAAAPQMIGPSGYDDRK